jgi:SAM-dependent methyltransferase
VRPDRRGRPHLQDHGRRRLLTDRLLDFGHRAWFRGLDAPRLHVWDRDAADLLRGPAGLDLRPGLLVADVGCGWGYLGHLLLPALSPGGRVDGYDLSEELLALGRRRAKEAGTRGLRFAWGDGCGLDVDDDRYDRAVCQTVLVHQSDPVRVLREMARVVKPGGVVVAIEPDRSLAALSRCADGVTSPEHALDLLAVQRHIEAGTRSFGAGDPGLGLRLPALFAEAGLQAPHAWLNPTLIGGAPPYDPAAEAWRQAELAATEPDAHADAWTAVQPLYEAGGGGPDLWQRTLRGAETARVERRRRLLDGTLASLSTPALIVCVARVGSCVNR